MVHTPENESEAKQGRLLNYRQDRRSILFLFVTLWLLVTPLCITIPGDLVLPWISLSSLFCFNACIIAHNHIHHATFMTAWHNELFSHLLGIAKGHTSTGVVVSHNLNHHRYHGAEQDWSRASLAGSGPGLVRMLRYVINASVTMARGRNAVSAPRLKASQKSQLQRERLTLIAFLLPVLLLDWRQAILFVFFPWCAGMAMLLGVNLMQHDGCQTEDPYRNSRNFTSRLANWFFLNNGSHTAHHLQPQLHWSHLRRVHEQTLSDKVPVALNKSSILAFLLSHYLLSFSSERISA